MDMSSVLRLESPQYSLNSMQIRKASTLEYSFFSIRGYYTARLCQEKPAIKHHLRLTRGRSMAEEVPARYEFRHDDLIPRIAPRHA
jgi:hypothetical protein